MACEPTRSRPTSIETPASNAFSTTLLVVGGRTVPHCSVPCGIPPTSAISSASAQYRGTVGPIAEAGDTSHPATPVPTITAPAVTLSHGCRRTSAPHAAMCAWNASRRPAITNATAVPTTQLAATGSGASTPSNASTKEMAPTAAKPQGNATAKKVKIERSTVILVARVTAAPGTTR